MKKTAILFLSSVAVLAVGSAWAADNDGSYKLNLNNGGHNRRIFVPVKVQSVFRPVEGSITGHPFKLVKASMTSNSVQLVGGNMVASDPAKGAAKVVIEFAAPQNFSNRTYQIRYNTQRALTENGDVKAPKVIYTALDKSGAVSTVEAVNGSRDDKLDYAMELKFYPPSKKGEQHGYIRLQIGTEPVSEIKGDFFVGH